jgi:hypothetical protein
MRPLESEATPGEDWETMALSSLEALSRGRWEISERSISVWAVGSVSTRSGGASTVIVVLEVATFIVTLAVTAMGEAMLMGLLYGWKPGVVALSV